MTVIDTSFNFYSDSGGRDPDIYSPTLRRYHKFLWSKRLPNGEHFDPSDRKRGAYLYHRSHLGEFYLGSDAITNSYRNQKRKRTLTQQIPDEVNELFDVGSTIGAYIVFPNRKNGGHTINQARGWNRMIDDRFDLTLECIRRFYRGEESPLHATLARYRSFFELFGSFEGYVAFFLLEDLVDGEGAIRFFLPFDGFCTKPEIRDVDDYRSYKRNTIAFVRARNRRIEAYATMTPRRTERA